MAKKKEEAPKKVLERSYVVPLRREWLKVPRYKRAKKASTGLRAFLVKHMKPEKDEKGKFQVKIGKHLNDFLWKHGIKNPPHKVKITAIKDDKGIVRAELEGFKIEEEKKEVKKKAETPLEKAKEKLAGPSKETKEIEKEELKEAEEQPEVLPKKDQGVEPKEFKSEKADMRAPKGKQGIARGEHQEHAEKK
jgi:ribosomal protein L31E